MVACADAGYNNTDGLERIYDKGIKVIIPQQKRTSKKKKHLLLSSLDFVLKILVKLQQNNSRNQGDCHCDVVNHVILKPVWFLAF